MELSGKTVLIVGLARTGVSAARTLKKLGARVLVNDLKSPEQLEEQLDAIKTLDIELHLSAAPDEWIREADLIVISPSVPIEAPFIQVARAEGVEVISEIELAYRLCKAPIVAITGTNGKTTTTALTGEIFKSAGHTTYVVGNIGVPFIEKVLEINSEDIVVAEISSFQLEGVHYFHPRVSAILNITEDHLNRHKTMENYIGMKARIFENATADDWIVINAEDPQLMALQKQMMGKVLLFSSKKILEKGAWVEEQEVVMDIGQGKERICPVKEIFIPGRHNLENALAASLMARVMGVSPEQIAHTLREFPGVEHRIERVDTINGVTFYNDSKGTNPDASIQAVKAMSKPTILIAGGMDKGSEFGEFIDAFDDHIIHMVVLGETADKLEETAKEKGFYKITRVKTLEEGVEKAFELAASDGNVLLSPACASWDMFKDYEERGRIFKEAVKSLRR